MADLVLPERFAAEEIEPFISAARDHLRAGETLTVDASAVERTSAAALQALTAVALAAPKDGCRLQAPSQRFIESAARLGLEDALGLDISDIGDAS